MTSRWLEHEIDLLRLLVLKELKLRYKNTALGYLWSVLHPLGLIGVYYAFVKIAGIDLGPVPYLLVLATGVFPWTWFTNSVLLSTGVFVGSANLIKKNQFKRWLLVVAAVLNDTVHFVVSVPIVAGLMLCYGWWTSVGWLLWVPVLMAVSFAMAMGLALAVASFNLVFRDLERLLQLVMTMWFFLSPVMVTRALWEEQGMGWLVWANPVAALILSWREAFLYGRVDVMLLATAMGWASLSLLLGWAVYGHLNRRFAELV
jgi:lipopolysaccharide transport system permease protein